MVWKTWTNPLCGKKGSWIFLTRGTLHAFSVYPFTEDSGTALKATREGGRGIEPVLKGSALLVPDLADTPGVPSTGWEWSWAETVGYKVLPS